LIPQNNLKSSPKSLIGWDVGGAHLKAALLDHDGVVQQVIQLVCPLWRGLDELEKAVGEVLSQIGHTSSLHAITMTGELVDLFESRSVGVVAIAQLMQEKLQGEVQFYAGMKGFLPFEQVAENANLIASANWLASAHFVANKIPNALFVDIGSTTTDFVVISCGEVITEGFSDAERLRSDALVYCGVVRTPIMALGQKVFFEGAYSNIAAEYFATTADVYRLTGDLLPEDDMAETADGAGKSQVESARRLARMIGHDVEDAPLTAWTKLAEAFKEMQLQRLGETADRVSQHRSDPLIGAGAGKFLVAALAKKKDRPYIDVVDLIQSVSTQQKHGAGVCLPAYAAAYSALDQLH
jgi:probable H4MPT-linked C1 transfer pathway protein